MRREWNVRTRGKEQPDDCVKTDLSEILALIMPEHGRLAKTMISPENVPDSERRHAIQDLYILVARKTDTLYRPNEAPEDGICPVRDCTQSIEM